jgi:transposase
LLLSTESQKIFGRDPVIFLLDNARTHTSKLLKENFLKDYNFLFNAPYTPELNPIELAFSKLKHIIRNRRILTEKDLIMACHFALEQITLKDAQNYIAHSFSFLKPAYLMQDF